MRVIEHDWPHIYRLCTGWRFQFQATGKRITRTITTQKWSRTSA